MAAPKVQLSKILPAWQWLQDYNVPKFRADLLAALIVIAMLVPQGMAYAMVAGLPPVTGLYASIFTHDHLCHCGWQSNAFYWSCCTDFHDDLCDA